MLIVVRSGLEDFFYISTFFYIFSYLITEWNLCNMVRDNERIMLSSARDSLEETREGFHHMCSQRKAGRDNSLVKVIEGTVFFHWKDERILETFPSNLHYFMLSLFGKKINYMLRNLVQRLCVAVCIFPWHLSPEETQILKTTSAHSSEQQKNLSPQFQ